VVLLESLVLWSVILWCLDFGVTRGDGEVDGSDCGGGGREREREVYDRVLVRRFLVLARWLVQ
jgi:hypothetical protein